MTLLGLDFPPISHLTRWPDIFFQDTPYAVNKTVLIYIAAVLLTLAFFFAAGRRAQLVPRGVQNVAESSLEFVRDGIILQTIGPEGMGYLPFLTAMFFFIFFANIFEVVPFIQFPGNASFAVPLILAGLVWIIFNVVGVVKQGPLRYLRNELFPPGVPKPLYVLVAPIELVSVFLVRPFSLAIRLFANMLAGHLILATFAILCASLFSTTLLVVILPFSFGLLIALTAFEILVAGLQAFIFTILTGVYVGSSMHPDH
ncbi:MAG: F0F1 ATP synthase subunit A [Actinomycetota bacterium]|jgi:F-type H+-transporting ATPase subunit a|nr:F0F1 ATP synthase subunit A [Actinomycetota bacterium]